MDEAFTQTAEIENTSNPEFHHERTFSLPVTKQLVDYLLAQPLIVEVWGSQAQLRAAGAAGAAEGGSRVIANATIEKVEAELRYYRSIVEKGKAKLEVGGDCRASRWASSWFWEGIFERSRFITRRESCLDEREWQDFPNAS